MDLKIMQLILQSSHPEHNELTHCSHVTHICISKLTIIGWDNGLSPGQLLAIIWTYAWILSIGPLGTNFSENLIKIQIFWFKKMHLKIASGKWWPFYLGLNVFKQHSSLSTYFVLHLIYFNKDIHIYPVPFFLLFFQECCSSDSSIVGNFSDTCKQILF